MRFATSLATLAACLSWAFVSHAGAIEEFLRDAAKANGFASSEATHVAVPAPLVEVGARLFDSKAVSLNGDIACRNCHLDRFGSADGIPNAIGVGGRGEGMDRVLQGGAIIPRNTLALWGRGGVGFDVFFWDGRIDFSGDSQISQFGDLSPSQDPLVVAVHLPPVQIREMIVEDNLITASKQESVESAAPLYSAIVERLRAEEPDLVSRLAAQFGREPEDISFLHVAEAIAGFIRHEFVLRETRFHRFVFSESSLTSEELRGGIIFYGKGKCAVCHSGPYLSDLSFHSVPLGQLGYGMNGFGVDYGRYNVTHDPDELYRFRTPPLFNVEKTAPYGHSGAVASLEEAVIHHFDPLRDFKVEETEPLQRHELYKSIAASGDSILQIGYLDDEEVRAVVAFLRTLSF